MKPSNLKLLRDGDAEFLWSLIPADQNSDFFLSGQKNKFGYGEAYIRKIDKHPYCRACGKTIKKGETAIGVNYDFTDMHRKTGLPLVWVHREKCI